jgi:hypothetical protein
MSYYLNPPEAVFEKIRELIKREDVCSVSCPFEGLEIWRVLVDEQLRRSLISGLPPQEAFFLCGPDSCLDSEKIAEWGGYVHIPYEGACGADLFVLPGWHVFKADDVRDGGVLRSAVNKYCHRILLRRDHGELACATREVIGDWTLYTSKAPYEDCNPFRRI